METEVLGIGNYYGGLLVKVEDGKYYWGIKDYNDTSFKEIPKSLYDEIIKFNNSK